MEPSRAYLRSGLTEAEAKARLARHGRNEIREQPRKGAWLFFVRQVFNPLALVLLAAAIVSLALGMATDATFIFIVIFVNMLIGGIQEYAAEKSAEGLKSRVPRWAHVVREGVEKRIPVAELAPGDLARLVAGDRVPADILLAEANGLRIDESPLTGESNAVDKDAQAGSDPEASPAERRDWAFAGTLVLSGGGLGEVMATGMQTEFGQIARSLSAIGRTKPPLLQRMDRFSWHILLGIGLAMAGVFAIAIAQGRDPLDMFLTVVALGVSAIPEGLPAAVAITLAIGVRRMAKRNVIVRRLLAVEALGSCTFIASDKTGTLTENRLRLSRVVTADGHAFDVADLAQADTKVKALLRAIVFANEARSSKDGFTGDSVDVACAEAAQAIGIGAQDLHDRCRRLHLTPYDSASAFCASVHLIDGVPQTFVKGAPERVLAMCARASVGTEDARFDEGQAMAAARTLAEAGYRVLAVAAGGVEEGARPAFSDLTWLGLIGMIDPPRPEAPGAIEDARAAGISIAMVTGDHPATALAVARQLGLAHDAAEVITGVQIKAAAPSGDAQLAKLIAGRRVFARIEPAQKQSIVAALKRAGHFVAVTGDGVNDAPALRAAHVGVAMGKRGSDVARDNADLILTDDNFASIVSGIAEGRVAYANIRKVVYLLAATGVAEVLLVLMALIAQTPLPLLPAQLLWLNLVTNGVQDVALAFDPAEGGELRRPPRHPQEPIFDRRMIWRVGASGLYMAIVAFFLFWGLLATGHSEFAARNIVLLAMVLFENVQSMLSRSERVSLMRIRFFGNPWLLASVALTLALHWAAMNWAPTQEMLHLAPAEWGDAFVVVVAGLVGLPILDGLIKWWLAKGETAPTDRAAP